jgi:hypothetical protein
MPTEGRVSALTHRIGRRGAILLILAVIDIAYGMSLVGPASETLGLAATIWREHYAPLWVWGVGWLVIAAILIVSAFLRNDRLGYAAAIGWKIAWSLTALASWIVGGVERGWVSSIVWAVASALGVIIAGWPEPNRTP